MNLTKKRKKKGFTLIELMAVVAIIAILAAVLVPTVNGYIMRAKKTAIITQIRTVVNAVESYDATANTRVSSVTDVTVGMLAGESDSTDSTVANFKAQKLLEKTDISKINPSLKYSDAKEMNSLSDLSNSLVVDGSTIKYGSVVVSR